MAGQRDESTDGQDSTEAHTVDAQPFFRSKRAAAVLKHAILAKYVVPFAAKTGSTSVGKRVVIVDGYAGAGRYEDGKPGSPALIADAARKLPDRAIECYFVEKDLPTLERLREVLAVEGAGIKWKAWEGTAEQHLDEVLTRADGVPLFLFLDPYGLGPAFDKIAEIFGRRPGGQFTPATEVFFRVDAGGIRRIRGVHHSEKEYPARDGQLKSLDRGAGGTWWRDEEDPSIDNEQYLEWFFGRYLDRLCATLGCSGWSTDVKQKPEHQPAYYMVFLTRHRDGVEVFGEALSRGLGKWRRAVFDEAIAAIEAKGQSMLMEPDELFQHDEQRLADQWHDLLERHVRDLLQQHERFVVREELNAVFGEAIGRAREMHLRVALKRLEQAGVTSSDSKGSLWGKIVVRAPGAQL